MNYRPKKMQYGGIQDMLQAKGVDGSFTNRKKLFNDYFKGNYTGTAEQNIQLMKDIQSGKVSIPTGRKNSLAGVAAIANSGPSPKPSLGAAGARANNSQTKSLGDNTGSYVPEPKQTLSAIGRNTSLGSTVSTEKTLESGVVVDKRKGKQYIIQNGKVTRINDVLTGTNVDGNSNSSVLHTINDARRMTTDEKATPIGYYKISDNTNDIMRSQLKEYDNNIRSIFPISAYGNEAPKSDGIAIHQTFDPEKRNKYYGSSSPWASFGCINCKKPDIEDLLQTFPKGDTLKVVDSKMASGKQYLSKYGIKQQGGSIPNRKDYMDNEEAFQQAMDVWSQSNQPSMPQIDMSKFMEPITEGNIMRPPPDEPTDKPMTRIEEGISKGIIQGPNGTSAQDYYTSINQPQTQMVRTGNNLRNVGLGMMNVTNILSEISGRVARGRQNQYDYNQQTALGQMNPMPLENFQPNPYSLYAKYGGKLKEYQMGGVPSMFPRKMKNITINNWGMPMQQLSSPMDPLTNMISMPPSEDGADFNAIVEGMKSGKYQTGGSMGTAGSGIGMRALPRNTKPNKPIVTNNPNDPRILAYQDSLNIYNLDQQGIKAQDATEIAKFNYHMAHPNFNRKYKDSIDNSYLKDPTIQAFKGMQDKAWDNYVNYKRLSPVENEPEWKDYNSVGFDLKWVNRPGGDLYPTLEQMVSGAHQKPVQPIIYKKPEVKKVEKKIIPLPIQDTIPKVDTTRPKRGFQMGGKYGDIHIKKENKGKFTDYCGGKVTGDCIDKGLNSPSATIRKRANFARNARKWN